MEKQIERLEKLAFHFFRLHKIGKYDRLHIFKGDGITIRVDYSSRGYYEMIIKWGHLDRIIVSIFEERREITFPTHFREEVLEIISDKCYDLWMEEMEKIN